MADFQGDFYVTCASVIPVLFLAVAVEGRVYQWALSTSERAEKYSNTTTRTVLGIEPPAQRPNVWQGAREQLADLAAMVLVFIALLIVFAGGLGEAMALLVLYQKSETPGDRVIVLVSTLVLVVAVIAGPAVPLGRSLWLVLLAPGSTGQIWQALRRARFQPRASGGQSTTSADSGRESSIRPYYDG